MKQEFIDRFAEMDRLGDNAPKESRRERGIEFEALLNDIFEEDQILLSRSYHTADNKREQIDAAIEINNRVFLVEVKWVKSKTAASELYAFLGKIENKFVGTLGIFISRNPLSNNFIRSLNTGRRQSVIIIHGEDVDEFFSLNGPKLEDYINVAIKLLSYNNRTDYPVKEYMKNLASHKQAAKAIENTKDEAKEFIREQLNKGDRGLHEIKTEFGFLPKPSQDEVFKFAIRNYSDVFYSSLIDKKYFLTKNYMNLFMQINPKSDILIGTLKEYFLQLLPKNLKLYGREEILRLYGGLMKNISDAGWGQEFEATILDLFKKNYGQYDEENILTDIIDKYWDHSSESFKDQVSRFYLNIFNDSSRSPKFAQKQFANRLVTSAKITPKHIEDWLIEKFTTISNNYEGNITRESAPWLTQPFSSVFSYIGDERWKELIEKYLLT